MHTRHTMILLLGLALLLTAGAALAAQASPKAQTDCPVHGKPVQDQFYTDFEGYRIYFCQDTCAETFNKKPKQYLDTMLKSGVTAAKTPAPQSICPPCGMKVDPKSSSAVEAGGYRFLICSDYCGAKIKADPAKYLAKLKEKGQEPARVAPVPAKPVAVAGEAKAAPASKCGGCGKCPSKSSCLGDEKSGEKK